MKTKKPLERYHSVVEGRAKAKYLLCRNLKEKMNSAKKILPSCRFCEHQCRVNRTQGERGFCGVLESRITTEFIHLGEEPELVPSHTIFFSGCTFHCVYCQNWDISQHPERGVHIEAEAMAEKISRSRGINVNWVGGDPTPNIAYILEVLTKLDRSIPQVWNSNMYLTKRSMNLLDGVIDLYLTDFKYGNDSCALRLSGIRNYSEIIKRNHLLAEKQAEVLIRHLVLPEHLECCTKPVLSWISENMQNARVNVMDQYHPEYRAIEYTELTRRLSWEEFHSALDFAKDLGLSLTE